MICPHCQEPIHELKYYDKKNGSGTCPECNRVILTETNNNPEINLPGWDRLISVFANELANEIQNKNTLFYRVDSKEIIEIGTTKTEKGDKYLGFLTIKPARFITLIEKYLTPGCTIKNKKTDETEFKHKSISNELAGTVLASEILQKALPPITRIFTIPIPILYKGELTFPKQGYDQRFCSWLPFDAPTITEPNMSIEEAKQTLKTILQGFCFETQQDYYNAIAALLTPYLRGLYPRFNIRTPVWFYLANRERAGKDYLAGITGLIYEGSNIEESPICNGEKNGGTSEELRKKILAAMLGGRKRMHFSNNKGYIDNAVFEQITTAETYTDRILGRSENFEFDNEIEFSLSGNVGVTFTPDFANRCRFIRLFLQIENANDRVFAIPDLHGYILENRSKILSALYALIRNWREHGAPHGTKPFASFHNWATICGGIMETTGYGNPCELDKEVRTVAGDYETQEMKLMFEHCYAKFPEKDMGKTMIYEVIKEEELFDWWDLENDKGHQTQFGTLLKKFVGRVLSDIKLTVKNPQARPARWVFVFTRDVGGRFLVEF